jgi:hypothetical protein
VEVDPEAGALPGNARAGELGRVLRYWGSATRDVPLEPGATQALMDSDHTEVGSWRVVEGCPVRTR